MFNQSNTIFHTKRSTSEVLAFIVVMLALMGSLVSCEEDNVEPDYMHGSLNAKLDISKDGKGPMRSVPGAAQLLVSGLQGASGSTIGPGGALYVTEGVVGRISRVDPKTGDVTTFASGFPPSIIGIGGVWDVAFLGGTAYALVTLVGPQFGNDEVVGLYRIDGPNSFTIVADIGAFSVANPPDTDFFVDMGVQYSLETFRGGFLVADGHHNRLLFVTTKGEITVMKTFGNVVPTGLAVRGNTIYMAEAGAVPHLPEDGKVVSFTPTSSTVTTLASGAPLLVDVEFNRGQTLFGLAQGIWDGMGEGSPAKPNTGLLVSVNDDGTFTTIIDGLDRPTSLEFIQNTAYIVTLGGEIWTVENVSSPPFGAGQISAKGSDALR